MDRLQELPSARVWKLFQIISSIPRASGNETAVSKWIAEYAAKSGAQCIADQTGNLIITARATQGYENAPSICFQAHMDMVAVQDPGHNHDFSTDPISLILKETDGYSVMIRFFVRNADNPFFLNLVNLRVRKGHQHR